MDIHPIHEYTGLALLGALAVIFTTLKLTGIIGWSWWWVLCPVWVPGGIFLLAILLALWMGHVSK